MAHADFVHLTVRTAYSLAQGALRIDELVRECAGRGMPAVAVTDTGNLFGALEFAVSASKAGIQPIIGISLGIRREDAGRMAGAGQRAAPPDILHLLACTETGYLNLLDLSSRAFLDGAGSEEPQVSLADLAGREEGLIALTGGLRGAVGRLLVEGGDDQAVQCLADLEELFPGRLYVELQRHGLEAEQAIEPRLISLAYDRNLPLVATNDCHFADADMYEAHDALLCIAASTTISDSKRPRVTPDHRFKSADEMRSLFADIPEAADNTLVIAQRCSYMPATVAPILPAYPAGEGRDEADELRLRARQGLEQRLRELPDGPADAERSEPYEQRLERELDIIIEMGFPGYFLIVFDFIRWARSNHIPVGPGRGSGAGSVVAWSLRITDLDPLRWGLLFERFLNPERVSMPDFDIDFCQDRRGEVIDYVQQRYGSDRVAQIITFGKLQARAVLRDVGRVLEMPYGQVDRICKLIPFNPANPVSLADAVEGEDELRTLRDQDESVARLIRTGLRLEGLYRNASTHAAGVVIGDRPLRRLVPLYRDPRSDMPATQFNMKWVENAGLVKFDFLGLKTLSVLQKAVDLLRDRGIEVDLQSIPLDDARTFEMISRGESVGVFQLESSGMRDVLKGMRPDRLEDIIALVALYRPGPMANIPSYVARKHGEERVEYVHPKLEPVLKETFGIMIYQEQVQQAAQILAGYSLGGADLLRRAMGKKIKAEMDAQRETFVEGCVERDVSASQASAIFETISAFAGYGFNKSHAAAYALIAYQTAWLKANYPVEFFAASMCYEVGNTDKLNVFREELRRCGIELFPPDVNRSGRDFRVEAGTDGTLGIRYALGAIRNVSGGAIERLEQERASSPFRDLTDFASRIDARTFNRRTLEYLIRAGAFDGMVGNRAQLLEGAELILAHASAAAAERESGQANLFGDAEEGLMPSLALPDRVEMPLAERIGLEFEAIGFCLSADPLDGYSSALDRLGVVGSAAIEAGEARGKVTLAGVVTGCSVRTGRTGRKFAFVQLSDRSGTFEVTVFSDLLADVRQLLETGQILLVEADIRDEEGSRRLLASGVRRLDDVMDRTVTGLRIYLANAQPVPHLAQLLAEQGGGGSGPVRLVVWSLDREVDIALPETYRTDARMRAAVKSLPGITEVREL